MPQFAIQSGFRIKLALSAVPLPSGLLSASALYVQENRSTFGGGPEFQNLREGQSVVLGNPALSLFSFHLCCKLGIIKCHPPGVCAVLDETGQGRSSNTARLTGHSAGPLRRDGDTEEETEARESCNW